MGGELLHFLHWRHGDRWAALAGMLVLFAVVTTPVDAQEKRILPLEFLDHSGFDSPLGCGCLAFGPLGSIFGRSKGQREYWELDAGFRDMLVSTLDDAYGYEVITPEEALIAMEELDISERDLRRNEVDRQRLAERLNATAAVSGTIGRFKQERARGMYRRDMGGITGSGTGASSANVGASTAVGVVGAYYTASVEVDFRVFARTGVEIVSKRFSGGRRHTSGGVKSGPLEAMISDAGATAYIGPQALLTPADAPPVVNPATLNQVAFGREGWDAPDDPSRAPNFRRTLLGLVTQDVMDGLVRELRERIGPPLPEEEGDDEPAVLLVGKVALIAADTGDAYINLGAQHSVRAGDRFRVMREGDAITDPDTGERLGASETAVGVLEVVEVVRDKLSRTILIEGEADAGDVVRPVVDEGGDLPGSDDENP